MKTVTNSIITVFTVIVTMFLTAGNGWAVAEFAKKYGMGCKSCHTFGSELNTLGLTFKKNGHNFGEKNAEQKPKPAALREGKSTAPETADKNPDKPGPVNGGTTADSTAVAEAADAEQPLPETKVYSWQSDDGTMHFSDTPYVKPPGMNKSTSDKTGKKSWRTGSRQLSAPVPKRLRKTVAKTASARPENAVPSKPVSHGPPEATRPGIAPGGASPSFEECMEQILAEYQLPETSEAAMEQFREAEDSCVSYEKKP